MKANFFERFSAYLIDMLIVTALLALIISFFPVDKTAELTEMMNQLGEELLAGDIKPEEYISSISVLQYDYDMKTILYSILAVFINMMYFMYYQFNKKGQTLGKQIMKIRVVKKEGNLELNDLVKRSLIINFVLFDLMVLFILLATNEDIYFSIKYVISFFQFGIVALSGFFVMFRKDKMAIHDFLTKTVVEREERKD